MIQNKSHVYLVRAFIMCQTLTREQKQYKKRTSYAIMRVEALDWLGRLDSNQRMAESKSAALPLGDAPVQCCIHNANIIQ